MFNDQLKQGLDKLIRDKKISVKFPRGYAKWKKRFNDEMRKSKGDVKQALDNIHGQTPQNGAAL